MFVVKVWYGDDRFWGFVMVFEVSTVPVAGSAGTLGPDFPEIREPGPNYVGIVLECLFGVMVVVGIVIGIVFFVRSKRGKASKKR